jgi:peptidoglycan/xylan/chitin deacetylase (PgdA/CDA1 family)
VDISLTGKGMKTRVKRILLTILAYVGYLFPFRRKGIRILYYHSVNPYRGYETNVLPEEFERQMRFLSENYEVISLKEAVSRIKKNTVRGNEVVVTFDDGYRDNYTLAYGYFERYRIPTTVFLTVGYVGTEKILPHDRKDNPQYNSMLRWDDIEKMDSSLVSFGAHSFTHCHLSSLSREMLEEEVGLSYKILKNKLPQEEFPFSYPYGTGLDFNDEVKGLVKKTGYFCACSAIYGVNTERTDIYALNRIGIDISDNFFTFRAKLNGALNVISFKDRDIVKRLIRRFVG